MLSPFSRFDYVQTYLDVGVGYSNKAVGGGYYHALASGARYTRAYCSDDGKYVAL